MPLRLEFDRGTITQSGSTEPEAARLPGVLWDARVCVHRAPAHRYAALVEALSRSDLDFEDGVSSGPASGSGKWSSPELRPYQSAALTTWELSGARGLIVLPTGSGKTRVAVGAMSRRATRVLCLVPTRVLLEQWCGVLAQHYSGPIGQYGDGRRNLEALTVATYASAFQHMESIGNRFDLVIVDEAHHFGTALEIRH